MPKANAEMLAREERVRELIRQRVPTNEICEREGYSESHGKVIGQMAKEMGISRDKKDLRPYQPYGLTGVSEELRGQLARHLNRLIDQHGKYEVSRLTGLSPTDQSAAGRRPWRHNWTLSQIERLAKARKISLSQLMQDATLNLRMTEPWPSKREIDEATNKRIFGK